MEFQNPKLKIFDIAGFYARAKVLKVQVFIARREFLVDRLKLEKWKLTKTGSKTLN